MRVCPGIALVVAISVAASSARADEFRVKEVRSLVAFGSQLEPHTLAFNDHHDGEVADLATGLIPFDEWARTMPLQKRFLSLYPTYAEPMVNSMVNGVTKPVREKLHMYVAEARFALSKPPQSIDLAQYMTIPFLERVDPAFSRDTSSRESCRWVSTSLTNWRKARRRSPTIWSSTVSCGSFRHQISTN